MTATLKARKAFQDVRSEAVQLNRKKQLTEEEVKQVKELNEKAETLKSEFVRLRREELDQQAADAKPDPELLKLELPELEKLQTNLSRQIDDLRTQRNAYTAAIAYKQAEAAAQKILDGASPEVKSQLSQRLTNVGGIDSGEKLGKPGA